MQSKFRFTLTLATALAVLAFSAVWAVPAFADDSTPPVVENPLDQVPEGTEIVVVNESGEVIPLATEEAAQALTAPDPIWCPTGVAPKPGVGGCSASQPNLSTLVATFFPTKAGTIWIENVADNGGAVTIDGTPITGNWKDAANFSLTLQGGWVGGLSGSKTILGVSTFNTAINIINWNGAVTINDITMNGASNVAYPTQGALYVETTKNIVLSRVTAINSIGGSIDGAYLDNRSSTTQASVTVKNSTFNDNIYSGLTIYSEGIVTLTNVNSNANTARGVYIDNNDDLVASAVTVTNSTFNGNTGSGSGLRIFSNGAVKLSQVTANDNGNEGVYVDNSSAPSAQSVTVTGSLNALYNIGDGLYIKSKGLVSLINLNTSHNTGYGTYINNSWGTPMAVNISGVNVFNYNSNLGLYVGSRGAITLNSATAIWNGNSLYESGVYLYNNFETSKPQSITLNGYNYFLHNAYNGLEIYSHGAITLNNVTADSNGHWTNDGDGSGVYLNNSTALPTKPANITVNGSNSITSNDGIGIEARSIGTITLSNITASYNSTGGAYLDNSNGVSKAVTIKGSGTFNDNNGVGLEVYSKGAVTISNLTANSNGNAASETGVLIRNDYDSTKPQSVTLKGFGSFLHNANYGLAIFSHGSITVSNVTATDNGNFANDTFGVGVYLSNIAALSSKPANIIMNGTNSFSYSDSFGLVVLSIGTITISNVTASNNGESGAVLDNNIGSASKGIVLKGNNIFSENSGTGLSVDSKGAITITNVTAHGNTGINGGVYLYNSYGGKSPVFVNGYGLFEGNIHNGLTINSNGAVTTNNLTANSNLDDGVAINTIGILAPQTVTLNGNNNFNYNGTSGNESGLYVSSDGTIKLSNVNASYNFFRGASLDNYSNWSTGTFPTFGSVTLSGFGNFTNNGDDGLFVYTHGAATLNYVTSSYNGDDGIGVDAGGNVTLACAIANNNSTGVLIYSSNILTLKGVLAAGNSSVDESYTYITLVRANCP